MSCHDTTLLLCSDLDGTLIPTGSAPESPAARPLFRRLAAHPEVCLAYVTGRDPGLVDEAIAQAGLPAPRFLLGDVGSSIYLGGDGWRPLEDWWTAIAPDWAGLTCDKVLGLIDRIPGLRPQEPAKQARFKASFYADPEVDAASVLAEVRARLEVEGVRASLIWSRDVDTRDGLLDVLPPRADKHRAIVFLQRWLHAPPARTVFAGDSGNDLAVLVSDIPSVLVANAEESVRQAALAASREGGTLDRLFLARGGYRGMNGNFAAGVLEGVIHFAPESDPWLDEGTMACSTDPERRRWNPEDRSLRGKP
jgi:hypothetical protein